MALLVQTLVVRDSRVLLGRWRSGAFSGRITGILGSATGSIVNSIGRVGAVVESLQGDFLILLIILD